MAVSTYEIIKGINQAASNARDLPESWDVPEASTDFLRREGEDKVLESRELDGFGIKINGDVMTIVYQSEIKMKEAHSNEFEDDIRRKINDAKNYLQEEYKNVTENSISFNKVDGSFNALTQYLSRVRIWVEATEDYKIPSLDPVEDTEREEKEDNAEDIDQLINEARQKAKQHG